MLKVTGLTKIFGGLRAVDDASLNVHEGRIVALIGPNGAGKTTMFACIAGFHPVNSGRVELLGRDITGWPVHRIARAGMVRTFQITQPFAKLTVHENIALTDPAMPMEKVIAAAKLAGAHEFILELPEGYDTIVGERRGSLSGGQRQRLAIARALVTDPRILIFDEATSALDYESERIVHDNMAEIARGRTVFIIAHRLSAVRHADRIITIDHGRIVEDGKHEDLMRTGGRYSQLYRLQGGIQVVSDAGRDR